MLDGTVSRVDPAADKVVQTIRVGHDPTAVAFAGGAVWVSNAGDRTLSKIEPRSGRVVATVPSEAGGQALAVDGSSLWAIDQLTDSVVQVDTHARKVLRVVHVGTGPDAIAAAFGSIWVANAFDGTVSRLDPRRGIVTGTIDVGGSPVGLAAAGRRIWVADEAGRRLLAVDPASDAVVRTVGVGSPPLALAAGPKTLWLSVGASPASHRGGTLRMLSPPGSLDTLDPALAYEISSANLLSNTNDGLVTFKRAGGSDGAQLVPDLAVSIPSPTDGGTTYTFQLRRGIRYSNGATVSPTDFRFALERDFKLHSVGTRFYSGLVGANACTAKPASCSLARGIVPDPGAGTVTFHLTAPDPDFLAKLALSFADALPAKTTPLQPATHPLPATGPYRVARYVGHRLVALVRNGAYHVWSLLAARAPAHLPARLRLAARHAGARLLHCLHPNLLNSRHRDLLGLIGCPDGTGCAGCTASPSDLSR